MPQVSKSQQRANWGIYGKRGNMARRKSFDVFKRDSELLEFMREHKGEEN